MNTHEKLIALKYIFSTIYIIKATPQWYIDAANIIHVYINYNKITKVNLITLNSATHRLKRLIPHYNLFQHDIQSILHIILSDYFTDKFIYNYNKLFKTQ